MAVIFKKATQMKHIFTENAPAAIGPYSQAVLANGILFTSGQIGINPTNGELITNDLVQETHQVMKNLEAILSSEGLDFSKVIKTTIFLKNMDDFAQVNEIYASYFNTENYPARETVAVRTLPKDVNVEISMMVKADNNA